MAAPGESLKSFVARRKAEYSLRFPFLKERQILVKLRRVWESQRRTARSTSCKAIQQANVVTSKVPNTTNNKKCSQECKENLSAYDVSSDSVVPLGIPAMRKDSKSPTVQHSANTSSSLSPYRTSKNCLYPQASKERSLVTCTSELLPPVPSQPLDKNSSHTLCPLENSILLTPNNSRDPQSQPSALVYGSRRNSPREHPPEETIASSWKRGLAGQQSVTNTVPFSTGGACCLEEGSLGDRKTLCPTLANQLRDSGPKQFGKQVMWETPTTLPSPPIPPARQSEKCDEDLDLQSCIPNYPLADVTVTPRVTGSTALDEEFELRDGLEATSLSQSPAIQSLPIPHSATPNVDTFFGHSEKARSTTLGVPVDAIRAFDTISRASVEVPILSAGSKSSEHFSDVPSEPSGPLSDNPMHPFHNSSAASHSEVQTQAQRHRSKINPRQSLGRRKKVICSSEGMRKRRYALDFEEASYPAKKQELLDESVPVDCVCDCVTPPHSGITGNNPDHKNRTNKPSDNRAGEHSLASVQIVPEDSIALSWNGSPTHHPPPSPMKHDLMCDMFQALTPDRHMSDCYQEARSHTATSKRRVFRSAPKEGDSNFSSMFVNDSDIFM